MEKPHHATPGDNHQRIAELVRLLQETERELQSLTGGQHDAKAPADSDPLLLREAQKYMNSAGAAQRRAAEMQLAN
jgi:hypothetical protein